jgi:hypothetical protein
MLSCEAMARATIIIGAAALVLATAAAARGEGAEPVPMRQRGLVYELGPELPQPEKEARADPRFLAASRYTTARQITAVAVSLLIVVCLAAFHFSYGARLAKLGRGRLIPTSLLAAGAVAGIVFILLLIASTVKGAFLRGAGAEWPLGASLIKPLCYGLGAGALAFAVAATRARWPRTWWIVVTFTCVAAGAFRAFFAPLPPAGKASSPPGGVILERAEYLSSQYQMPPYEIAVERRAPADRIVAAVASPARRALVISAGAESLSRYEAEVFLATAIARAEAKQNSLMVAAALVVLMASLLAADWISGAVVRRRDAAPGAPAELPLFFAVFVAIWLVTLASFNYRSRQLGLRVDEEVITLTRKPIAAVTLYYKEARANLVAAEPNAVLHFLVDAAPSAAERAAQARRLRDELAQQ